MTDQREHPPETAAKDRSAAPWKLTDDERAAIRAAVAALPPLTDEQVDALCEIIIAARNRRQRLSNDLPRIGGFYGLILPPTAIKIAEDVLFTANSLVRGISWSAVSPQNKSAISAGSLLRSFSPAITSGYLSAY